MQVWLLQAAWDEHPFEKLLLHLPNSGIWIWDDGYEEENLVNNVWTQSFWDGLGADSKLTYIGEL